MYYSNLMDPEFHSFSNTMDSDIFTLSGFWKIIIFRNQVLDCTLQQNHYLINDPVNMELEQCLILLD